MFDLQQREMRMGDFRAKAITERRKDPVRFKSSQDRERREGTRSNISHYLLAPKFEPSHKISSKRRRQGGRKKYLWTDGAFKFNVTRQYHKRPCHRWSRCYIHQRLRIQINIPGNSLTFRSLNAKWPPQALQVSWLVCQTNRRLDDGRGRDPPSNQPWWSFWNRRPRNVKRTTYLDHVRLGVHLKLGRCLPLERGGGGSLSRRRERGGGKRGVRKIGRPNKSTASPRWPEWAGSR